MSLTKGERANFETLLRAARNGDLALIESTVAETGERVAILCAVAFDGREYHISPFGHLCPANPFEFYADPASEGERPCLQ